MRRWIALLLTFCLPLAAAQAPAPRQVDPGSEPDPFRAVDLYIEVDQPLAAYQIELKDGPLDLMTFRGIAANAGSTHPFLFLNACDVGSAHQVSTFVDGWAPAALEMGQEGLGHGDRADGIDPKLVLPGGVIDGADALALGQDAGIVDQDIDGLGPKLARQGLNGAKIGDIETMDRDIALKGV